MKVKVSGTQTSQRCAKCGACTVVCPVYKASGGKECYSGRGKKHLLEVMGEGTPSPIFEDIFSKCLLCGSCVTACPRGVDIPEEVRRARSDFSTFYGEHGYLKFLARKVLLHPELLSVVRTFGRSFAPLLEKRLPAESGLRLQMAIFDHEPIVTKDDHRQSAVAETSLKTLVYFPGCSATHLYPETINACRQLLRHAGYELVIPEGLGCCGLAIDAAGDGERSRALARKNILALERYDGPIMVSCGSCYAHLQRYHEVLAGDPAWQDRVEYVCGRLVEMSQLLDQCLPQDLVSEETTGKSCRVFYHDPCHLRHGLNITREPRNLLRRVPSIELLELPDGPQCCGHGGLFHLGAPELSAKIRDDLAEKVLAMAPDIITSSCSGCLMQWKTALAAAGKTIPVLHLAELLLQAYQKKKSSF
ncbi:(Fe-S)-binding protein [Desulfopila aestuarii]|uniref:Glycolate oxidase iron-sulfur subunit n=1 Tax=Desulfopila aestuarii DSM 18488 TaxID=1121416 RepID=A0A1M7Y4K7_9BACT|nr:(Fe-S)-binding protein [Desulfopila aestuarii]SHO47251.1 glycolate oxidase iron-sulfur subunit [Desulfopila aestuarii DSM 18488]